VEPDAAIGVLSLVGLATLLFLAGMELDLRRLQGRALGLASGGFALSFALALPASFALGGAGAVDSPLLVAVILSATALGVVVPLLKDLGEAPSPFGQLVIASASVADFGTIVLLSLLFSREATGVAPRAALFGIFALLVVTVGLALAGAGRVRALSSALDRLKDTTSQIKVRGAFLLLVGFAVLAERLGLETILGAFAAGALLRLLDHRDATATAPNLRPKLEAVGYGVFVPAFFVSSGIGLDLDALFAGPGAVLSVPLFLAALLLVRGLPALLYLPLFGGRRALAAALLQATSLSFVVAATQIGRELGLLSGATAAALVAAGLLSVLLFPLAAAALLPLARTEGRTRPSAGPEPAPGRAS
jgi:Kef-type K+ transport system membrane component KefB